MRVTMTVAEYAEYTRHSPYTVRKWCREGKLEGAFKPRAGIKPHWCIRVELPEKEDPPR